MHSTETDIVIMGAGPAGAATALRLSYLGVPCTLIDKSDFPRDKICGDALSGKITTLFNRLDPAILDRFRANFDPADVWGIRFYPPNKREIQLPFKVGYERVPDAAPGYLSRRLDFDMFMIDEVRRRDNINLLLNTEIGHFERSERGYRVTSKDGQVDLDCRLLIDGTGAHSRFSRLEAGFKKDLAHHAGAVRQYYQGVTGFHEDNYIELHFLKEYNPGYFWMFPLPNGLANIGLGMRTDFIQKRKVNLRKELEKIVASPAFRDRFKDAKPLEKPIGYGLPLGSKKRPISGDHYLLIGDAGHLIDPLTGEGIGNGVYSGFIAAELIPKCLEANRFDAAFLKAYDVRVARVLGTEMKLSYNIQRIMQYPWLTTPVTNFIAGNPRIVETLCRMNHDFELRKQVVNPFFWLKQMFTKSKSKVAASAE
ncbi:MAG: NAD(P)/FAD-dependent oxidoreductase [Bacteroidota bacterium]